MIKKNKSQNHHQQNGPLPKYGYKTTIYDKSQQKTKQTQENSSEKWLKIQKHKKLLNNHKLNMTRCKIAAAQRNKMSTKTF